MGSSNHLKRLAMPRSWPLPRKTTIWVTRPTPGAHSLELCMPINLVIRDVLGFAQSTREVRHILHNGLAKVDGRVCKETRRQMFNAVIIRQRRPFRRVDGTWVQFEDNACVITNEKGDVQGSDIKGPVSREAAERWPRIAANAKQII